MFDNLAKVIHYVSDVDRSRPFYEGVLGLTPTANFEGWVEYNTRGATLCLHDGASGPRPSSSRACANIGLSVDDLRAAIELIRERGGVIARDPHHIQDNLYVVTVRDPDGIPIDISGPM